MNKVTLNEISETALIAAMEANMFGYMAYYANQLPQMEVFDRDDFLLINSGLPSDTFNYVCRSKFDIDNINARIDEAINNFKSRNLPFAWWVGPGSQPGNLGVYLEKHGLTCTEYSEGMAADLRKLPESHPLPDGLTIKRVSTVSELNQFANVVASVFNPPDACVQMFYEQTGDVTFKNPSPIHLYLGYLNGEPVSTSVLFLGVNVAGIYSVATVEQVRNRGIGTALTLATLHDAREQGYQIATLQASEEGQNLYARIGFKACCKFLTYQ